MSRNKETHFLRVLILRRIKQYEPREEVNQNNTYNAMFSLDFLWKPQKPVRPITIDIILCPFLVSAPPCYTVNLRKAADSLERPSYI